MNDGSSEGSEHRPHHNVKVMKKVMKVPSFEFATLHVGLGQLNIVQLNCSIKHCLILDFADKGLNERELMC